MSLSLRDAQRVVAAEHGFDNWTRLKDHISESAAPKMIEMTIDRIQMHPVSGQRVLVLREKGADKYLPIWIGPVEADSIALRLEGQQLPRPLTHDLMESMISDLGARVSRVVVSDIRDHTFFAKVVIQRNGTTIESDSRTSDAIALAVRSDAPIYAAASVLELAGVTSNPETGLWGSTVFDWQDTVGRRHTQNGLRGGGGDPSAGAGGGRAVGAQRGRSAGHPPGPRSSGQRPFGNGLQTALAWTYAAIRSTLETYHRCAVSRLPMRHGRI